jgi:starvation-inducible outer membrane lipoprotein
MKILITAATLLLSSCITLPAEHKTNYQTCLDYEKDYCKELLMGK